MQIIKVELKNFKRFTDLTIDGIPADTRLVLLIGSNGSGKSSVFDAFEIDNSQKRISPFGTNDTGVKRANSDQESNVVKERLVEFKKSSSPGNPVVNIATTLRPRYADGTFIDETPPANYPRDLEKTPRVVRYYGRTSFRHIARLTEINPFIGDFSLDDNRPKSFIDKDNRFSDDIGFVTRRIVTDIFREQFSSKEIQERYIVPINDALGRVFEGQPTTRLSFLEIIPPGEGQPAKLTFTKGDSEIAYDDLSAGEKETFNILFNLFARRDQYTDTVYFFDELDLHLNTRLQFNLLKEITENWLPENCQLWTASHSLGFIEYTRQYEHGVIIDFDDLDFDQPQLLFPQPKQQLDVYDVAVPKEILFEILKGKRVVVCENQNDEFYNLLALPKVIFVGMKDARSVFLQMKNDNRYHALRDRDFLSDAEVERIRTAYPNYHILDYYDFENYLYHPDNLGELAAANFDKAKYIADITHQKNERLPYILTNLTSSRQTYEEFKTDENLRDKLPDAIVDDFRSDDFERFYKFFDMKDKYKKTYLMQFNLIPERLVQTRWFRQQIAAVLDR